MRQLLFLVIALFVSVVFAPVGYCQNCAANHSEVEVPNNNPGGDPEPWPVGFDEGECMCNDYSYMILPESIGCLACLYTVTWTWESCVAYKEKHCYRYGLFTNLVRIDGAPDCCGPAEVTHLGDPDLIDRKWWERVPALFTKSVAASASIDCGKGGIMAMTATCPASQMGVPSNQDEVCDAPMAAFSGVVLRFAVNCLPCGE